VIKRTNFLCGKLLGKKVLITKGPEKLGVGSKMFLPEGLLSLMRD